MSEHTTISKLHTKIHLCYQLSLYTIYVLKPSPPEITQERENYKRSTTVSILTSATGHLFQNQVPFDVIQMGGLVDTEPPSGPNYNFSRSGITHENFLITKSYSSHLIHTHYTNLTFDKTSAGSQHHPFLH